MLHRTVSAIVLSLAALGSQAANPFQPDTILIPERAVTIGSDGHNAHDLIAVLYSTRGLHYSDPNAPRFLFLDREGKVALGIGGYVKGTVCYDFDGAIDSGSEFQTYLIPVPPDPALRNRMYGNANTSTIFLQMVGRTERFGTYEVYVRTNFQGGGAGAYGLKLKQAYLRLGNVVTGLTRSSFVDGSAGTPCIDDEGPTGELGGTNLLIQYRPVFGEHWSGAVSVENSSATYTVTSLSEAIPQRVPDIPLHFQYMWGGGTYHVRASLLWRALSYRDIEAQQNKFVTAWGAQLSGLASPVNGLTAYWQCSIGHGYARYTNDLAGNGYDLVPDTETGRLVAPLTTAYEIGFKYSIRKELYMTSAWSETRLPKRYGMANDAYRYGRSISVSAFYSVIPDMTVGVEYLNGRRANFDRQHGTANRINAMLKYRF